MTSNQLSVNNEAAETLRQMHKGQRRKLHWKNKWLIYNFYARCNVSMSRISPLFGVGKTLVHDVVYAWANLLCTCLAKFFSLPTRSQILRAYPKSVIRKFRRADICMLLDATEIRAEVASMKTVNAVLYSPYKHSSTIKWLAGCCPIGAVSHDMIGAGHGGYISDPIDTAVLKTLKCVPFGMAVNVAKGFLIENECALLGVGCVRPVKLLDGQAQQLAEDAALTQKVGKTRIVIEQKNGQMNFAWQRYICMALRTRAWLICGPWWSCGAMTPRYSVGRSCALWRATWRNLIWKFLKGFWPKTGQLGSKK